jgi:hypothetical protein
VELRTACWRLQWRARGGVGEAPLLQLELLHLKFAFGCECIAPRVQPLVTHLR